MIILKQIQLWILLWIHFSISTLSHLHPSSSWRKNHPFLHKEQLPVVDLDFLLNDQLVFSSDRLKDFDIEIIAKETKYYNSSTVIRVLDEFIFQTNPPRRCNLKRPLVKSLKGGIAKPVVPHTNPFLSQIMRSSRRFVAPMAIILLTSMITKMPPMNKQSIPFFTPFFQGWLIRTIDPIKEVSCVAIVGSFSPSMSAYYQQHYIFTAVNVKGSTYMHEEFPDPKHVIVKNLERSSTNFIWQSEQFGYFHISDGHAQVHFRFPQLEIYLSAAERMPWADSLRAFFDGPEGWLGKTSFLPSRYNVHSIGSSTDYNITVTPPKLASSKKWFRSSSSSAPPSIQFLGSGFSHIEGNYGNSFPEGWIWSQGIGKDNNISFSFVSAKTMILGMSSMGTCLFFRKPSGERIVFRSIDLDRFDYEFDGIQKTIIVEAKSFLKQRTMKLVVDYPNQQPLKPKKSYFFSSAAVAPSNSPTDHSKNWHRVYTPTEQGFQKAPGCEEHYHMTAKIILTDERTKEVEEFHIPMSALEFGGEFMNQVRRSSNSCDPLSSSIQSSLSTFMLSLKAQAKETCGSYSYNMK